MTPPMNEMLSPNGRQFELTRSPVAVRKRRKSVCVITFSPVARDARVLRQIQYLSPHYDLTVIGHGEAHPSWRRMEGVTWVPTLTEATPEGSARRLAEKAAGLLLLLAGRLHPSGFFRWYWRQPIMRDTLAKAVASGCDAFHANDWNTLPVAAEAARRLGGPVVFDDHEYAPMEYDNDPTWRLLYAPMIRRVVAKYAARADAMFTVAPAIAERYRREFGLDPTVLMNAPARAAEPPAKRIDFDNVRLIHHGVAIPIRRLELMIEALALAQRRFSLHFMLTGPDTAYLKFLRRRAEELAPGRVEFHDPVPVEDVLRRVSEFDMGFYNLPPDNFVHEVALPNKFFDFIHAGLPVCIGPSPSMAEIVRSYGLGCVAASFEPRDVAAALDALTPERLAAMREGARRAAREINAEREMAKLVAAYKKLLPEG
jgi:glycosyltransferase involved in cell wall biosynthesis